MALETAIEANKAWEKTKATALNFKRNIPSNKTRLSTGDTTLETVFAMYETLQNARNALLDLSGTAELDAFVQTLPGRSAYVATTQITAVTDAMLTAMNWIDNNAASLSLTGDTAANWLGSGSVVTRRFTAGQLSALRGFLDDIDAEII
tara:strand:- start:55 stop:501 length:447 start_codon:yes stop_codon:yes gene_type:complete